MRQIDSMHRVRAQARDLHGSGGAVAGRPLQVA
jgi:hypothetical protein